MPNSVSGSTTEHICSEIKKIEDNPQNGSSGPAINNLPAERGSQGGTHFEGMGGKKS